MQDEARCARAFQHVQQSVPEEALQRLDSSLERAAAEAPILFAARPYHPQPSPSEWEAAEERNLGEARGSWAARANSPAASAFR